MNDFDINIREKCFKQTQSYHLNLSLVLNYQ